jgi:hypothetical protein
MCADSQQLKDTGELAILAILSGDLTNSSLRCDASVSFSKEGVRILQLRQVDVVFQAGTSRAMHLKSAAGRSTFSFRGKLHAP